MRFLHDVIHTDPFFHSSVRRILMSKNAPAAPDGTHHIREGYESLTGILITHNMSRPEDLRTRPVEIIDYLLYAGLI